MALQHFKVPTFEDIGIAKRLRPSGTLAELAGAVEEGR
jgi:hypothetical protein